jgi:hypothetical protein
MSSIRKWGIVRNGKFHLFPKSVQDAIHYSIQFRLEEEQGLHTPLGINIGMNSGNSQANEEGKVEFLDSDNALTADTPPPQPLTTTKEFEQKFEQKLSVTTKKEVSGRDNNRDSKEDKEGGGGGGRNEALSSQDRQHAREEEDRLYDVIEKDETVTGAKKWRDKDTGIMAEVSLDGKIIQFNGANKQHYMIDMHTHILFNTDDPSMTNVNVITQQEYFSSIQSLNPGHLVLPLRSRQGSMLLQYPQAQQEDIATRTAALATHVYGAWFFCLPAAMSHAAAQ